MFNLDIIGGEDVALRFSDLDWPGAETLILMATAQGHRVAVWREREGD